MARDEVKQLRAQLEATIKESNGFKREKHDMEIQVLQLQKEMEKIHHSLIKHASTTCKEEREMDISGSPDQFSNDDGLKNVNSEDGLVTKACSVSENESISDKKIIDEYIMKGALPKDIKNIQVEIEEKQLIQKLEISKSDDTEDDSEYLIQRAKMLQLRLDDAQKAIISEKE